MKNALFTFNADGFTEKFKEEQIHFVYQLHVKKEDSRRFCGLILKNSLNFVNLDFIYSSCCVCKMRLKIRFHEISNTIEANTGNIMCLDCIHGFDNNVSIIEAKASVEKKVAIEVLQRFDGDVVDAVMYFHLNF
jgi:hypothetical protein